jgi:hypothetical protein
MTEDKGISFRDILIGAAIGIVIVYFFLRKQPTPTLNANSDINLVGLNGLQQKMDLLEQKLDILNNNYVQNIQIPTQIQQVPTPIIQAPTQQIQTSQSQQTVYTNKMHIVRDQNGDIIDIIRDAKIGNR